MSPKIKAVVRNLISEVADHLPPLVTRAVEHQKLWNYKTGQEIDAIVKKIDHLDGVVTDLELTITGLKSLLKDSRKKRRRRR